MRMLGRLVSLVTSVVVAIIVVAIALVLLEANQRNDIVNAVVDAGRSLTEPFAGIFKPGSLKARIGVNWGLAAVVYSLVGGLIARLLLRR
jgi:hypothetical protein